jgi:hypothetical protein
MEDVGIFYGRWFFLRSIGIYYVHWVYFVVIWYKFSRFGLLYKEKSGNPA